MVVSTHEYEVGVNPVAVAVKVIGLVVKAGDPTEMLCPSCVAEQLNILATGGAIWGSLNVMEQLPVIRVAGDVEESVPVTFIVTVVVPKG